MDILLGLFAGFLVFVLPFIVAGVVVFGALALVVVILAYCLPRRFTQEFIKTGLIISLCAAVILSVPAYIWVLGRITNA
jgi:hypothetical protein